MLTLNPLSSSGPSCAGCISSPRGIFGGTLHRRDGPTCSMMEHQHHPRTHTPTHTRTHTHTHTEREREREKERDIHTYHTRTHVYIHTGSSWWTHPCQRRAKKNYRKKFFTGKIFLYRKQLVDTPLPEKGKKQKAAIAPAAQVDQ